MTDTANLGLPCIEASQAQKHVTHNDALRILDTLVHLAVLDRDLTAPPGAPTEGQSWIVNAGATGVWSGHVDAIASWQDGAWQFNAPRTGWLAYVIDESMLVTWDGSAWVSAVDGLTPTALNNLTLLGVGTTADGTNPLSAKLNNALFAAQTVAEGGDGNLRYVLSKESSAKTLSFLFQDNYSGRAEIGLTGDDDFHFKVSPDGTNWFDGIVINRGSGAVTFPNSTLTGGREVLTAARTYYVRSNGSDSNNGLANTSGGAFLTIQKAIDVTFGMLDLAGYNVTVQIADGTYTGGVIQSYPQVGAGTITIQGNSGTPANVLISTASADAFLFQGGAAVTIKDLKITTATGGNSLYALLNGIIYFSNLDFGSCAGRHIRAEDSGSIKALGNYTISGGAVDHFLSIATGMIRVQSITITLTGTPAFSGSFANAQTLGILSAPNLTFSGSATGKRYSSASNAVVFTNGGPNYFPGNSAGSNATGSQYL